MVSIFNYPIFFIMAVAAVLALTLALIGKILIDQDRLKEIQQEVKDYNKELMAATRAKDQKKVEQLNRDKAKIMQLQSEMMKLQLPQFAAMLPFFIVFMALRSLATSMNWGEFMQLPFTMPMAGTSFTWLGWYIMCSLPFTTLFKKALGVK